MEATELFVIPGIYGVPGVKRMWYDIGERTFHFIFDNTASEYVATAEYLLLMSDDDPHFDGVGVGGREKIKEFVKRIHTSSSLDTMH